MKINHEIDTQQVEIKSRQTAVSNNHNVPSLQHLYAILTHTTLLRSIKLQYSAQLSGQLQIPTIN